MRNKGIYIILIATLRFFGLRYKVSVAWDANPGAYNIRFSVLPIEIESLTYNDLPQSMSTQEVNKF